MKKSRWIWVLGLIILVAIGYYLISPAFKVVELEEASPIIKDAMEAMDAETKLEFEAAVEGAELERTSMDDAMPSGPSVISEGDFKPRAHEVEGQAILIETETGKTLRFEDFDTINGPNLHVYLSSELGDNDFIDLGKLKATQGNFNYELDSSIDTEKYNKVLVWCVPFGVLFSYAEI